MMPPYKLHEYRASSGNSVRMKVYRNGGRMAVDASWESAPTAEDMRECSADFHRWLKQLPEFAGFAVSVPQNIRVEDAGIRDLLARLVLVDPNQN